MVFLARAVFLLSFICFFHCVMRRTRRSFHPTGERALLPLEFSIRIALFRPLFNTSVPVTCTSLPLLAPHRGTDLPRPPILPPINPLHDSPCSFPRVRKLPTNKTISISRFIYIYSSFASSISSSKRIILAGSRARLLPFAADR